MKRIISQTPSNIDIIAPASKSMAIRSIVVAMLSLQLNSQINEFKIHNFSVSQDVITALSIAHELGFIATRANLKTLMLKRNIDAVADRQVTLNCGESALCWRIFSKITPIFTKHFKIIAADNVYNRTKNDKPIMLDPMLFCDKKNKTNAENNVVRYELDCNYTSQDLTAFLLCLPFLQGDFIIVANHLVSKGYVDLTIDMLAKIGINIVADSSEHSTTIKIKGNQRPENNEMFLEGDWSAGAFFFVLGAIAGGVSIANLSAKSMQPDRTIIQLFDKLNIHYAEYASNIFNIEKSDYIGFEFDATNCPDLIPALVVLAFNATSQSTIHGISRLINKESNRRDALLKTFSMLGGRISISGDSFYIHSSNLSGGFADSNADHRIAMAIGIAAKICKQPITLTHSDCVTKSFPAFWNYIK